MKLAEKANLSVGYICDLEMGRRWGTPETFAKLADALNISPFELLLPQNSDMENAEYVSAHRTILSKLDTALRENVTSAVNKAISETFLSYNDSVN